jgi:hypothetical protein
MSIKGIACVASIVMVCTFSGFATASDDGELATVLRQVVEQNLAAYNREEAAGAMDLIHTKSPEYSTTEEALPGIFEELDVRTELVGFQYIGHDDEFAVARVKFKTTEQSGELFSANVVDTITVFHQENGVWKYWSDHILGVEFIQ